MNIERELLKQIATILSTHLGDEMQRRAIIEAALFQSPILDYIEWRGASYPFAVRLTRLLIRLEDGNREEPELVLLLRDIREQVGYDRQLEIDEVIETLTPAAIGELAQLSELARNYVFISYTHHNADFVERLRSDLRERKVNIWVDFIGLKAGTPDWEQAIRDAIRDSRAVLLVASPQARESFYVRDEIAVADMEKKPLYPVWASGEHWIDSVPLGMGHIQYIDARASSYDVALDRLVEIFRGKELETIIIAEPTTDELPPDFIPRNPYKGLRAFRAEDRRDFFGQDSLIREFVDALQADDENSNCLAVIGPSGSGKSSVVMAGLIPALQNGALPGSAKWVYPHPIVPGLNPLSNLTAALGRIYSDFPVQFIQNSIRQALRSPDKMGLYSLVQERTAQKDERLVLYIDQFEELFTLTESEDERQHFIDLLVAAATESDSRLILILSMRADFFDRPMEYHHMGQILDKHSYSVLPMRLADLHDVIVKPAQQGDVRLEFDEGLVTELVYAVRDQTGALPLLQFTLDQLFERRDGRHLTLEAYDAIGGLQGALAKHAQATYERLPASDQGFVRPLFLRLIEPGQTEQDTTRRRASTSELDLENPDGSLALKRVAETFVDARLLLTDNIDGVSTLEVSHEALIREWDLLQRWLEESRDDLSFQSELSRDVGIWVRRGRGIDDDEVLYRGTRLYDAENWIDRNTASKDEHAFILASAQAQLKRIAIEEQRIQELHQAEERADRSRQVAQQAEQLAKRAQIEARRRQAEAEQASVEARTSTEHAQQQRRRARTAIRIALALIIVALSAVFFAVKQLERVSDANAEAEAARSEAITQADLADSARSQIAEIQPTLVAADTQIASVKPTLDAGSTQVAGVVPTLSAANTQVAGIEPTLLFINRQVEEGEALVESLRLASMAQSIMINQTGNVETASLLAIQGLKAAYSMQADTSLLQALDNLALLKRLAGHTNTVTSVAFSPDGTQVISGSRDATLILWEINTGQILRTFIGHTSDVTDVAFSPDGNQIVSSSADGTLILWDKNTGQMVRTFTGHTNTVTSVAFSPDGTQVISGSRDATLILWEINTGQILHTFAGYYGSVFDVAFSPDGTQILGGSHDATVTIWDITTRQVLYSFTDHIAPISSVAFSPDGTQILSASLDDTLVLREINTGQILRTFIGHTSDVTDVAFSPDGNQIASSSADGTLILWDKNTGQMVRTFTGHLSWVDSVAFSPDGEKLISGSLDQTLILWDVNNGQTSQGHVAGVTSMAFSVDRKQALSGSCGHYEDLMCFDGELILWDIAANQAMRSFTKQTSFITAIAFSQNGRWALSGSADGSLIMLDLNTGQTLVTFAGHASKITSVAFSPNGTWALSGSCGQYDYENLRCFEGEVALWDIGTGNILQHFYGHTDGVASVAFSPDGTQIVSGSFDGSLILWNIATGQIDHTFIGHNHWVQSVAFSPDGTQILSASTEAILWDRQTGEMLSSFGDSGTSINSVAFSPDGTQALIDSLNGKVSLWDFNTNQVTRTFTDQANSILSVAFSLDGRQIISGSENSFRMWYVDYHDTISYACTRITRDLTAGERQEYGIDSNEATCSQFVGD